MYVSRALHAWTFRRNCWGVKTKPHKQIQMLYLKLR